MSEPSKSDEVRLHHTPVADCRQVILNDSASMTSTPELLPVGLILLAIACTPWKVPARIRYSFCDSGARPSGSSYETGHIRVAHFAFENRSSELAGIVLLVDQPSRFVYNHQAEH
jgi:hypothetical protein